MQTSKSYLHAHTVRAGFDEKTMLGGRSLVRLRRNIIWKSHLELCLRAHHLHAHSWEETSIGNNYLEKVGKTKPAGPSASLSHSLGRWSPHRLGEICFVIVSITIQVDLFSPVMKPRPAMLFLQRAHKKHWKWTNSMKGRYMIFSQW